MSGSYGRVAPYADTHINESTSIYRLIGRQLDLNCLINTAQIYMLRYNSLVVRRLLFNNLNLRLDQRRLEVNRLHRDARSST